MSIIDAAVNRTRAVILILLLIFIVGSISYVTLPKEHAPDIKIPIIYVSVTMEGISPDDAERMILRPLEIELRSIEGVKEMKATATEGRAVVTLEFQAGLDSNKALQDVREKVDQVVPDLPEDADEPQVTEVSFSMFPVLNVILTGNVPEAAMLKLARDLRDEIEALPEVLNVDIAGDREEALDIVMDPLMLESYGLTRDLLSVVAGNNKLVAAGAIENDKGNYSVKVPGLLENLQDVLNLPLRVNGDAVVTVSDLADVRKTFKDPKGFARVNGKNSIALEVAKRTGKNVIQTIEKVRMVVEKESQFWPAGIEVIYAQDGSKSVREILSDLQNNIVFAMILVMVVVLAVVGVRSAGLVAFGIPGAFLFGLTVIAALGLTMNIVVLFSLILSIGLLVDSSIVVTEYADRKMLQGVSHKKAYIMATKRMAWPIIASTITTIVVFSPLLSWPGTVGQFMKYMPITIMAVLTGSLLMALIFIPVVGTAIGGKGKVREQIPDNPDLDKIGGFTGKYVKLLNSVVSNPGFFSLCIGMGLGAIFSYYTFIHNYGVEFFPKVEPDNTQIQIRARGNLSVYEKDELVQLVEERVLDMHEEVRVFYARSGSFDSGKSYGEDTIGVIQMELGDWDKRRKSDAILDDVRARTADIAGIVIETSEEDKGPGGGKPIQIQTSSRFSGKMEPVVAKIREYMDAMNGLVDVEDSRPVPAIEWEVDFNREQAIRYGLTAEAIGDFVKLVTKGLKITEYRPDDADDEVDVVLRYPESSRNFDSLKRLKIITPDGAIPLTNFVNIKPVVKVNRIERVDGKRVYTIKSDVAKGTLADQKVKEIGAQLIKMKIDPTVSVEFKGEDEDQKEAMTFLVQAFGLALFSMVLILVVQFNSIFQMFIIMSAVFLSTMGVLLGLLITGQPFGIVMCGVGVIALAGIVVNNNIIFIDTFKLRMSEGLSAKEALLRTGANRLRPILLTAGTTVLGLIPMVLAMNIDFVERSVTFDAPSTQWWRQLSTSIAGGLTFATVLTLFFTPALLMLGERWFGRKRDRSEGQKVAS